ncbi:MAG: glycosyltransferase [Elusimicrobiaceae bacterium]|nr:glycosyltransferase [Elusimicrobiaceae bacterium]
MNQDPLISILIPVYNAQSFLEECLESVLSQTYNNLEIICIDDGSTDQSAKVMEQYTKKDKRVQLICQLHQGIASTRNHLVHEARGEYIAFVDADDKITPTYIEELLKVAKKQNADVVRTLYYLWKGKELTPCEKIYKEFLKKEPSQQAKQRMQAALDDSQVWLKLIKTSLIRENKISFLNDSVAEDISFEILLYLYATNIIFYPRNLYFYRVGNISSLSSDKQALCMGTIKNLIYLSEEIKKRKLLTAETGAFLAKMLVKAIKRMGKFPFEPMQQSLCRSSVVALESLLPYCAGYLRVKYSLFCWLSGQTKAQYIPVFARILQ